MADEIQVSGRLLINTTNSASLTTTYKVDLNPPAVLMDLASVIAASGVQEIPHTGVNAEALDKGEVAAGGGLGFFRNIGTANDVKIGVCDGDSVSGTFRPLIQLKPGEYAIARLANQNVMALAITGSTQLQYHIQSA